MNQTTARPTSRVAPLAHTDASMSKKTSSAFWLAWAADPAHPQGDIHVMEVFSGGRFGCWDTYPREANQAYVYGDRVVCLDYLDDDHTNLCHRSDHWHEVARDCARRARKALRAPGLFPAASGNTRLYFMPGEGSLH